MVLGAKPNAIGAVFEPEAKGTPFTVIVALLLLVAPTEMVEVELLTFTV